MYIENCVLCDASIISESAMSNSDNKYFRCSKHLHFRFFIKLNKPKFFHIRLTIDEFELIFCNDFTGIYYIKTVKYVKFPAINFDIFNKEKIIDQAKMLLVFI